MRLLCNERSIAECNITATSPTDRGLRLMCATSAPGAPSDDRPMAAETIEIRYVVRDSIAIVDDRRGVWNAVYWRNGSKHANQR